jgi:hypothetical protein
MTNEPHRRSGESCGVIQDASAPKGQQLAPTLQVKGSIVGHAIKLQWEPVPRARAYVIEWLRRDRKWVIVEGLEGDEMAPNANGFIEYVDDYPNPMGPGGTYRVTAHFSLSYEGRSVRSSPVVLTPNKPKRSTLDELQRRLERKKWSPNVKSLISRLKWSQHGWTTLLPREAGKCLGKRIEVEVQSGALTNQVLDLLAVIFENLPKLALRAQKAFNDYSGGLAALDDDDQIDRPRIVIDDRLHEGKTAGRWTMVIEIKGSDYGWHIEFVRGRFKEIWAGD